MSDLMPYMQGVNPGAYAWLAQEKAPLREKAHQGASPQAGGAPGASLEVEARLMVLELWAMGQSQDWVPVPGLHVQLPVVPTQGRAWACKRLQVCLHDLLAESWPGYPRSMSVGLPGKAAVGRERLVGAEETSHPQRGEARGGWSPPGCDERSPTLSKEEPPKGGPLRGWGGGWRLLVVWSEPWWGRPPVCGRPPRTRC